MVQAGDAVTLRVVYTPSAPNPLTVHGKPLPDMATLRVVANAAPEYATIPLSGVGTGEAGPLGACPTAVGEVLEGALVIPQTRLRLFSDGSFAASGVIGKREWSVEQPAGSASVFIPSKSFPNPTFEANVAGEYVFSLDVWDENGVRSCAPWQQTVLVVPDEAIHLELVWRTPKDPDNLNVPQHGVSYAVGVHYWSDHEFGDAYATVRIYIDSNLVFESGEVRPSNLDMWDVARIEWPKGTVIGQMRSDGSPRITAGYQNPYFAP